MRHHSANFLSAPSIQLTISRWSMRRCNKLLWADSIGKHSKKHALLGSSTSVAMPSCAKSASYSWALASITWTKTIHSSNLSWCSTFRLVNLTHWNRRAPTTFSSALVVTRQSGPSLPQWVTNLYTKSSHQSTIRSSSRSSSDSQVTKKMIIVRVAMNLC